MRTLREQEQEMAAAGFFPGDDFETPEFTPEDLKVIKALSAFVIIAATPKIGFTVEPYMCFYHLLKFFSRIKADGVLEKFEHMRNENYQVLYRKLELHADYQDARDFIINDGGVVSDGKAYETDGITLRSGWSRLYWK